MVSPPVPDASSCSSSNISARSAAAPSWATDRSGGHIRLARRHFPDGIASVTGAPAFSFPVGWGFRLRGGAFDPTATSGVRERVLASAGGASHAPSASFAGSGSPFNVSFVGHVRTALHVIDESPQLWHYLS